MSIGWYTAWGYQHIIRKSTAESVKTLQEMLSLGKLNCESQGSAIYLTISALTEKAPEKIPAVQPHGQ